MDTLLVVTSPQRVRECNDAFRWSFASGWVVLTADVAALLALTRTALLAAVRGFEAFDAHNDPHG